MGNCHVSGIVVSARILQVDCTTMVSVPMPGIGISVSLAYWQQEMDPPNFYCIPEQLELLLMKKH